VGQKAVINGLITPSTPVDYGYRSDPPIGGLLMRKEICLSNFGARSIITVTELGIPPNKNR